MPDIWFGSDHHFGHQRIIELCNRPFDSVEEMDEKMIQWHNEIVKPDDIFIHVGDLALGSFENSMKKAERLNGRKILVPGNHDRVWSKESEKRQLRFRGFYEAAGFEIWPEQFVLAFKNGRADLTPGNDMLAFSHLPSEGDSHGDDRYKDMRPVTDVPIVCGHVHDEWTTKGRNFNVGVDVRNFRPVHLEEVLEWTRTL